MGGNGRAGRLAQETGDHARRAGRRIRLSLPEGIPGTLPHAQARLARCGDTDYRTFVLAKKYQAINARLARTLKDTVQGAAIIKGRELEQLKQKIAQEKNRYRWLENISAMNFSRGI